MSAPEKAIEALMVRDECLRRLVEESPVATVITGAPDDRVISCNRKFSELFGYTREDIPDLAHWWPLAYPDESYREAIKAQWLAIIAQAERDSGETQPMEATVTCKNGSQRIIEFRGTAIGTNSIVTFVDLTERKRTEDTLRASEERFRSLFERSLAAYQSLDIQGRFLDVNPGLCRLLGYEREELLGRGFDEFWVDDIKDYFPVEFGGFKAEGEVHNELQLRRKDGTTVVVTLDGVIQRDERGNFVRTHCILHDITRHKQAEAALRKSEQQFRTLAENSPDIIVRYDLDGRPVYVNPAYERETGIPGEKASSPTSECEWRATLSDAAYQAKLRKVMDTGVPGEIFLEWPKPDGTLASYAFHVVADRDPGGQICGALAIGHDIIALKRQDRIESARLRVFERLVQGGTLEEVLGLVNSYVEEARPQFLCSIMLVSPDGKHLLCMPASRLPAEYLAAVNGILIGDGQGSCGTAAWRGETVIVEDVRSHPYWKPYTHLAVGAQLLSCWSEPIFDSSGKVLGTFGIYQHQPGKPSPADRELLRQASYLAAIAIERRQAEKVLMQYAAIIESSDDAIVGKDLQGIVTSWNKGAEKIFGYVADEVVGQPIGVLIPPTHQEEERMILDEIRRGQTVKHYETVRRCKGGQLIDVSVTVSPLRDAQGKIVGASKIARDITARKQAEAELLRHREHLEEMVSERTAALQAANRELESFTYTVSHDLRTPLRAIDGFSGMLSKKYARELDEEAVRLIGIVRKNTARMSQLIDDMLAFANTGRLELRPSRVDMEHLVRAVWMQLQPLRADRDVRFDVKPLPAAWADLNLIRQVWTDLLGNAIKFSQPRPVAHVEVGGMEEGSDSLYYVKDDGVGFNPAYVHKLFGVFQRLHGIDEFEGTGIGLAIVKRAITRHGGRVMAEGNVGGGATFRFTLPTKRG